MHKRYKSLYFCLFPVFTRGFFLFLCSGCISVAFCSLGFKNDFSEYFSGVLEGLVVPYFDASGVKRWELSSQKTCLLGPEKAQMYHLSLVYYAQAGDIFLEAAQAQFSQEGIEGTQGLRAHSKAFYAEGMSWKLRENTLRICGNAKVLLKNSASLEDLLKPPDQ